MGVAASVWLAGVGLCSSALAECPTPEAKGRPADAWLTIAHGNAIQHLQPSQLAALPGSQRSLQRRLVAGIPSTRSADSGTQRSATAELPADAQSTTTFSGWLLRDVLAPVGYALPTDRGARLSGVEAVALDGWRAWFSWGEVFNSAAGEQMLVIQQVDGVALDTHAGPLALRALADTRPGPRHVRQLCALIVLRR
jgi:hypothetical protein